jgi:hypothetical protein
MIEDNQIKAAFRNSLFSYAIGSLAAQVSISNRIPKILWLYTELEYGNSKMIEQMLGNRIAEAAGKSGYEVRKVSSWSAYRWLSEKTNQTITKTMQNMHIEESVSELLRMALLMEHGGIMLRVSQSFLVEDLNWVAEHFEGAGA